MILTIGKYALLFKSFLSAVAFFDIILRYYIRYYILQIGIEKKESRERIVGLVGLIGYFIKTLAFSLKKNNVSFLLMSF